MYSLAENRYLAVSMDDEEIDTLVAEDLEIDIEEIDPIGVIYIASNQDLMDTLKSAYEVREYNDELPGNDYC